MPIAKDLLERIKNNDTKLKYLILNDQELENDDIKSLRDAFVSNTTIKRINLSNNKIGSSGAQYLAELLTKNISLQSVNLGNNQIGNVGIKHLAPALEGNTTLQSIYLNNNNITQFGAKYIGELISKNKCLQCLDISENNINDSGINYLVIGLEKNTILLSLLGIQDNNGNIAKYLERNKSLAENFDIKIQSLLDQLNEFEPEDLLEQLSSIPEENIGIATNLNNNLSCITETKNTEIKTTANTPFCFFVSDADIVNNDPQNTIDPATHSDGMKQLHG